MSPPPLPYNQRLRGACFAWAPKNANLICITLHVINVIKDDYHWKGLTWSIPKIVINSDTEHHEHEQSNDCIGLLAEKFNLNINPGIHEDGKVAILN